MVLNYPRDLLYIYISRRKQGDSYDAFEERGRALGSSGCVQDKAIGVKTIEDIQFSTGPHACLFDHCQLIYFKIDKTWTN